VGERQASVQVPVTGIGGVSGKAAMEAQETIRTMTNGQRLERLLSELRARARDYFPELREVGALRVIWERSRPYSTVYLVAITEAGKPARELIIKQREDVRLEFNAMNALWPHFATHPHWKIPRPLDCLDNGSALVMEAVSGRSLQDRLPRFAWTGQRLRAAEQDCRRAGEWLRFYHDLGRTDKPVPFDVAHKWKGLEESAVELAEAGFSRRLGRQLVDLMRPLAEQLTDRPLATSHVHGDFSPDNLILNGPFVTALDLSAEFINAIYHDIASFLDSLLLLRITRPVPWNSISRLQRAVIEGYFNGEKYEEAALVFLQGFGLACGLLEILGRRRSAPARAWIERFLGEVIDLLPGTLEGARAKRPAGPQGWGRTDGN
jgi:hypothetical protein